MHTDKEPDSAFNDPLGIEIFLTDETFEDIFNSLKAAYYQKYLTEFTTGDNELAEKYRIRSNEIARLKKTFSSKNWVEKNEAIDIYGQELYNLNHTK
jgi:hypothetical protein